MIIIIIKKHHIFVVDRMLYSFYRLVLVGRLLLITAKLKQECENKGITNHFRVHTDS